MRDADERGDNKYLEWRSRKKDLLLKWSSKGETTRWSELHDFVKFTHNNLQEIKEDKRVVDERDPYRGEDALRFSIE